MSRPQDRKSDSGGIAPRDHARTQPASRLTKIQPVRRQIRPSVEQTDRPVAIQTPNIATAEHVQTPKREENVRRERPRLTAVKCRNCGARSYFRTNVALVSKCQECGDTLHVRPRSKSSWKKILSAVVVMACCAAGILVYALLSP